MHVTFTEPQQITSGTAHHGFTSCAYFQGLWYVAYRTAETHHPAPPGHLTIARASQMDADTWLALANGATNWAAAMATGKINASGARADLSEYLPLQTTNKPNPNRMHS